MADKLTLARRLYEGWNERNFDELADTIAPDGKILVMGTGDEFVGPEGSTQYNRSWYLGFPDGHISIDNILAAADTVVVEFTGRGTHTGTLVTSMGELPARAGPSPLNSATCCSSATANWSPSGPTSTPDRS